MSDLFIDRIVPYGANVLLKILEKVPEHFICKVIAVGEGYMTPNGIIPLPHKVGDRVLVQRYAGTHYVVVKGEYYLVESHRIRAKYND